MWFALSLLLSAASPEGVAEAAPCRAQLQAELQALGLGGAALERLRLEPLPEGGQRLTLLGPGGEVLGERALTGLADCAGAAKAAAAISAAWLTELDRTQLPASEVRLPVPAGDAEPAGVRWEVGVSGRALVSGAAAPRSGLAVPVTVGPGRGIFGGRAEPFYDLPSSAALGPGAVQWQRFGLGLGVQAEAALERLILAAHLQLVGAGLSLAARGFSEDGSALALDGGAAAGGRVGWRLGAVGVWLELAGVAWARRSVAVVEGVAGTVALPAFELSLAVGVSWSGGRAR